MEYRKIIISDLHDDLLVEFGHEQHWTKQWVKRGDTWVLEEVQKHRTWSPEKRRWIAEYLREQIERGGAVVGAYDGERFVGFAAVDGCVRKGYANLTMLFVDDAYQRMGIGKVLFAMIRSEGAKIGTEKLFISAVSSEDTIAFYLKAGCMDAEKIIEEFCDTEEDRFLECPTHH